VSIDTKTLIINFECVEKGIVPISGVENNHVSFTLEKMPDLERKIAARKFRKILKKAVQKLARDNTSFANDYETTLTRLKRQAGLGANIHNTASSKKIQASQSNFRRWIVSKYLLENHLSNT